MRISHRHLFVFVANPRTASTTVRQVLGPYSDIRGVLWSEASESSPFHTHMKAVCVKEIFDERRWDWFSYKRFCVVRNPYDRVVSLYHHQLKRNRLRGRVEVRSDNRQPVAQPSSSPPTSFSQFVRKVLPRKPIGLTLAELVNDADGVRLVDTVLRFENLREELPEYLGSLDIQIDAEQIPHLRHSAQREQYQGYYDPISRRLVGERYRSEVEEFGYEF